MAAVTRTTGAPSGSLYHRFPSRTALLAGLWLRTVRRFHDGLYSILDSRGPASEVAINAARYVVTWCRRNALDAHVMLAGQNAFEPASWSTDDQAELRSIDSAFAKRVTSVINDVATQTSADPRLVRLAVIELPYAAVLPYLSRRASIPKHLETTVATAVTKLLT